MAISQRVAVGALVCLAFSGYLVHSRRDLTKDTEGYLEHMGSDSAVEVKALAPERSDSKAEVPARPESLVQLGAMLGSATDYFAEAVYNFIPPTTGNEKPPAGDNPEVVHNSEKLLAGGKPGAVSSFIAPTTGSEKPLAGDTESDSETLVSDSQTFPERQAQETHKPDEDKDPHQADAGTSSHLQTDGAPDSLEQLKRDYILAIDQGASNEELEQIHNKIMLARKGGTYDSRRPSHFSLAQAAQDLTLNVETKAANATSTGCDASNLVAPTDWIQRRCGMFLDDAPLDKAAIEAAMKKHWLSSSSPQTGVDLPRSVGNANKYLFLTYGPPASGKGGILKQVIAEEERRAGGKITIQQPVEVLVDELIAAWPGYEAERRKCGDKAFTQTLYWQMRGDPANAEDALEKGFTPGVIGIDKLSDDIQKEAAAKGHNLQIELTGRWIDKDWFSDFIGKRFRIDNHYKVIVAYPYVATKSLQERAKERRKLTGQEAAPDDEIAEVAVQASANLEVMMDDVDTVYLWDNNGPMGDEKLVLQVNKEDGAQNYADCAFANEFLTITREANSRAANVVKNLQQWLKKYWEYSAGPPIDWRDDSVECGKLEKAQTITTAHDVTNHQSVGLQTVKEKVNQLFDQLFEHEQQEPEPEPEAA